MVGFGTRIAFAFRALFAILFRGEIPEDIVARLAKSLPEVSAGALQTEPAPVSETIEPEPESFDRAVQMLALLQRDGRLIDFLSEDVAPYPDAQLGAAVRSIHENCRQVLDRYMKLEPVIDSEEDRPFTVQTGFEPASIKLVGNVAGEPPLRGVLRHRGWRVRDISLPSLPDAGGRNVVAPAEVEIP